jgi:hypothetical protein
MTIFNNLRGSNSEFPIFVEILKRKGEGGWNRESVDEHDVRAYEISPPHECFGLSDCSKKDSDGRSCKQLRSRGGKTLYPTSTIACPDSTTRSQIDSATIRESYDASIGRRCEGNRSAKRSTRQCRRVLEACPKIIIRPFISSSTCGSTDQELVWSFKWRRHFFASSSSSSSFRKKKSAICRNSLRWLATEIPWFVRKPLLFQCSGFRV